MANIVKYYTYFEIPVGIKWITWSYLLVKKHIYYHSDEPYEIVNMCTFST